MLVSELISKHIQMLLETFYEDRTKILCTGAKKKNSNTLRAMTGIFCY